MTVGFLTLIALSLASIWLHEREQRDAQRAITAHALEAKLVSLLLNLRRAESSQRGYLIVARTAPIYRAQHFVHCVRL